MKKFVRGLVLAGAMAGVVFISSSDSSAQATKTAPAPGAEEKTGTLELYKDKAGLFRFRAVGADGKGIMQSSKGYATKEDAQKAVDSVKSILSKGKVVEPKE